MKNKHLHHLKSQFRKQVNFGRWLTFAFLLSVGPNCKPSEGDKPNEPQGTDSSVTLVVRGHNQTQQTCILLVELATRTGGAEKKTSLNGRLLKYTGSPVTEIKQAVRSTLYDMDRAEASIFSFNSPMGLLESRLKVVSGYSKTINLSQNQILTLIRGEEVMIAQRLKQTRVNDLIDVLASLLVTPAYAQNSSEIDRIIVDIIEGVKGLKDCAPSPNLLSTPALIHFTRETVSCVLAINDLAQATKSLWDYVATNVSKALDPSNAYSASNLNEDLKKSPSSTTGTNTQTGSASYGGSFGDPHLITLDGLYYDFQGYGEFVAVKSLTDNFEIQVRQQEIKPYINRMVTMNTGVSINTGTDVICILPGEVYINKVRSTFSASDRLSYNLKEGRMSLFDNTFKVVTANNDIIIVEVQNIVEKFINFRVFLNENRKGKVKGVLGNFDGNRTNDVQTQDGTTVNPFVFTDIYPTYANSWRITQANSLFAYTSEKTTVDYTKIDYPNPLSSIDAKLRLWAEGVCQASGISAEPFFSACVLDVALSGSDKYGSSSFNAYKATMPGPSTSALIDGKWKYEKDLVPSCGDLVGSIIEFKDGESYNQYVPNNSYGWKAGQLSLTQITQTSPNSLTALGYSRAIGGTIASANIKVNVAVATGAQSMTVTYTNVCNPVQFFVREK